MSWMEVKGKSSVSKNMWLFLCPASQRKIREKHCCLSKQVKDTWSLDSGGATLGLCLPPTGWLTDQLTDWHTLLKPARTTSTQGDFSNQAVIRSSFYTAAPTLLSWMASRAHKDVWVGNRWGMSTNSSQHSTVACRSFSSANTPANSIHWTLTGSVCMWAVELNDSKIVQESTTGTQNRMACVIFFYFLNFMQCTSDTKAPSCFIRASENIVQVYIHSEHCF